METPPETAEGTLLGLVDSTYDGRPASNVPGAGRTQSPGGAAGCTQGSTVRTARFGRASVSLRFLTRFRSNSATRTAKSRIAKAPRTTPTIRPADTDLPSDCCDTGAAPSWPRLLGEEEEEDGSCESGSVPGCAVPGPPNPEDVEGGAPNAEDVEGGTPLVDGGIVVGTVVEGTTGVKLRYN